jgi:uncharacterized protein
MPESNVEIVRRAYEAWNRGDFEAAAELLDSEIEWQMPSNIPDAGTYRGPEEVRRRLEEFLEVWDEFKVNVEELIDEGDRVIALIRYGGLGSGSGIDVQGASVDTHVWTLRDGKAVRLEMRGGTGDPAESVDDSE